MGEKVGDIYPSFDGQIPGMHPLPEPTREIYGFDQPGNASQSENHHQSTYNINTKERFQATTTSLQNS